MHKYLYACAATAALGASAAMAGPGGSCHFHGSKPAAEAVVMDCANQRKEALISEGKIDKSWSTVTVERVELVDGKKGKEWRIALKNPAVNDSSKQTLYIFFTAPGNFIAANFTGQ